MFNKNYKLLHAYVQCVYIVSTKYQIASSKAVVGVAMCHGFEVGRQFS